MTQHRKQPIGLIWKAIVTVVDIIVQGCRHVSVIRAIPTDPVRRREVSFHSSFYLLFFIFFIFSSSNCRIVYLMVKYNPAYRHSFAVCIFVRIVGVQCRKLWSWPQKSSDLIVVFILINGNNLQSVSEKMTPEIFHQYFSRSLDFLNRILRVLPRDA